MKTDKEYVFALGDLIQWIRFQANWDEIEDWDGEFADFMHEIEVKTPEDITDSDIRYLLDTVEMTSYDTHVQRSMRILEGYLAAETSTLPSYVGSEDGLKKKAQEFLGDPKFHGIIDWHPLTFVEEEVEYKVKHPEKYITGTFGGLKSEIPDRSILDQFNGMCYPKMIVNCPPQHSKTFISRNAGEWKNSGIGYSALESNHDWQFLKIPVFEDPRKVDRFQCYVQDYALKADDLCKLSAEEVKQIDDLMHRQMLEELYRMEEDSIIGIDRGKSNDYNESTTRKEDKDMEFTQTAEATLSATIFTEKARVLIVQETYMSGSLHNQKVDLSAEVNEQSLESIVKSGGKKAVLMDTESVSKILKEYLLLKEFYRDSKHKIKPSLKEKAKSLVNKASWASVGAATALGYLLL